MYANFDGVQLRVLENQQLTFYIMSPLFLKNRSNANGNFKNFKCVGVP
jgi:hypothetical protein